MKQIKRMLLILLACLMVLGLIACKKDEDVGATDTTAAVSETAAPVADVSFFDYNVIRPAQSSDKLIQEISAFYGRLMMVSDQSSMYEIDEDVEADAEKKEILIGHTNRPETQEVRSKLSGSEYAVAVVGNKLVITGLTDNTTVMAMRYFMDTYLTADATGLIAGDLFYQVAADVATIAENGTFHYTLVCSEDDYTAVKQMGRLYSTLRAATGLTVTTAYDDAAYDPNAKQILLGYTDYAETKTVADATEPEGYTVDYVGNKIVIFGWTGAATVKATDEFISVIASSSYLDDNGNTTVSVMKEKKSAETVGTEKGDLQFFKDIPMEVNGKKTERIYDAGDNAMMLYWANTAQDSFTAYTGELTSMGFAVYHSVDNTSIKATTYTKDTVAVHVYYLKRTSELRAVVYYDMELPVKPYSYTKVCEPAVTQLRVDEAGGGMSYLVRLEDGTFVVIDGGNDADSTTQLNSADAIYNLMRQQKPAGVDELVITAWFVTHAHPDHLGGVKSFIASSYKDDVTVKMLVGNDVSDYMTTIIDNPGRYPYYSELCREMDEDCVYVKGNTGQQFFFPGVTVDILYSPADVYPGFIYEFNAGLAMAFRLTVNESATHESQTFMFLGDVTKPGAEIMAKMYAENLKSDAVQVGHHGHNGGSQEFYEYCDAPIVLIPNTKEIYDGQGYKTYSHVVWAMENADRVIMAWQGNYTFWYGADAN